MKAISAVVRVLLKVLKSNGKATTCFGIRVAKQPLEVMLFMIELSALYAVTILVTLIVFTVV